jgi:hypothetical protein
MPAWWRHGWEFIRAALHVFYRAELLGLHFEDREICCAGWRYGLSGLAKYRERLFGEPAAWEGRPISELAGTPPPYEFRRLFDCDTGRYVPPRDEPDADPAAVIAIANEFFEREISDRPGLSPLGAMGPSTGRPGLAGHRVRLFCG